MGTKKICFDECYDICLLNICEKHSLIGKNCIQSLKNIFYKYLTHFLDAAGWPNIWFLSSLSLSMFTKKRCSKLFWNKMSMIDNRSFCPPQTYLEYLDTDKMRGWAYKSIWNIWTRKKWEAKLKILNEMRMLHLPLKLSHSALVIYRIVTMVFQCIGPDGFQWGLSIGQTMEW